MNDSNILDIYSTLPTVVEECLFNSNSHLFQLLLFKQVINLNSLVRRVIKDSDTR